MTFKKLLKEAAKVDPSTFKLGPKVKIQPRIPEKAKSNCPETKRSAIVKPVSPITSASPVKSVSPVKTAPRLQKSGVDGTLPASSITQSESPRKQPSTKFPPKTFSPPAAAGAVNLTTVKKDAKSRGKESFASEPIPPPRVLQRDEEVQNGLWRKKRKNYHSPAKPLLRKRERDEDSEDSFISSEDEMGHDYRSEIRAMFQRNGRSRAESDSDDSDMEATGAEMAREEAEAERLARIEDEEEIRLEEARIREKKRRKR